MWQQESTGKSSQSWRVWGAERMQEQQTDARCRYRNLSGGYVTGCDTSASSVYLLKDIAEKSGGSDGI
jgi:hypothetical protein